MHEVSEIKNYGSTKISVVRDNGIFLIKKELIMDNFPFNKLLEQEIKIMKLLNHKNIISLINSTSNYILMEYATLGDLKELITKMPNRVISKREYFFSRILEGVQYLHSQNVVHNDLKLSNIFITKDNKVKIGDFGLSCTQDSNFFNDIPEYIFKGTYSLNKKDNSQIISKKDDIYSLGIMIFELYTFKDPSFSTLDPNFIDDEQLRNLFISMISENPPTIDAIIKQFKNGRKNIF